MLIIIRVKSWEKEMSDLKPLKQRAHLLKKIREFFYQRQVLEVETPLLCSHSVTDPYIDSFRVPTGNDTRYLQTSPEYAMKRLLADGSGSIYQICKAFRYEEAGKQHSPEFTMLEWYRVDFSMQQLMQEVAELLQELTPDLQIHSFSYQKLFLKYTKVDPFTADIYALQKTLEQNNVTIAASDLNFDDYLNLIMNHLIEPQLPSGAVFIYNYPVSQAALAQLSTIEPRHALRFEVYLDGIEIANGFQELQDSEQQRQRFIANNQQRQASGKEALTIDPYFIAALQQGLPNCSGVALGFDRLLQNILKTDNIGNTLSFSWNNI